MSRHPTPGEPEVRSEPAEPAPVDRQFVVLYAVAYFGTQLVFLAPLLVTLASNQRAGRHRPGTGRAGSGYGAAAIVPVKRVR